jgi:hypothetical protein
MERKRENCVVGTCGVGGAYVVRNGFSRIIFCFIIIIFFFFLGATVCDLLRPVNTMVVEYERLWYVL